MLKFSTIDLTGAVVVGVVGFTVGVGEDVGEAVGVGVIVIGGTVVIGVGAPHAVISSAVRTTRDASNTINFLISPPHYLNNHHADQR